jgi:hypothetical protein
MQFAVLDLLEKVPGGHDTHALNPALEYVPAAHASHTLIDPLLEKVPLVHS